jgi:hypothetical protein
MLNLSFRKGLINPLMLCPNIDQGRLHDAKFVNTVSGEHSIGPFKNNKHELKKKNWKDWVDHCMKVEINPTLRVTKVLYIST